MVESGCPIQLSKSEVARAVQLALTNVTDGRDQAVEQLIRYVYPSCAE